MQRQSGVKKINNGVHNTRTREEVEKSLSDYPLIPMGEIDQEARLLAVRWVENYEPCGFDLPNKHKLASDIMNYARRQKQQIADADKLPSRLIELWEQCQIVYDGVEYNLATSDFEKYIEHVLRNAGKAKDEANEISQENQANNKLHERALDASTDQIIRTQKERNEKEEEIKRLREALDKDVELKEAALSFVKWAIENKMGSFFKVADIPIEKLRLLRRHFNYSEEF